MSTNQDTPEHAAPAPSGNGNGKRKRILLIIAAVFVLAAIVWLALWLLVFSQRESTEDAYVGGNQVIVSSQVPGTVIAVMADDTQRVRAGQVLVKLDPTDSDVNLAKARSALASAVRQVRQLTAGAGQADAGVDARRVELRLAEADARTCLELRVVASMGIPYTVAIGTLVAVLVERGELDRAREALAQVEPRPDAEDVLPSHLLRESRVRLLLACDHPDAALEELDAYVRWIRRWRVGVGVAPVPWRSLATFAHLRLGGIAEARRLAHEEVELARRFGAAPQIGMALRARGLAEGGHPGVASLEEAVSVLASSDARLEQARALVDLGSLLRRAGARTAARERLAEGMDLAHRCGATALVDRAREELRLAGARPRRVALSGRDALTPSELRIAAMAAEGMPNKAIAQAQFVTLRTVEMHLSNAYGKLAIGSRRQLARALES